ncbi:MAG: ATP phosphoribosyltransferase regulatory subunit, partial [Pseudomonadota bacterium]|nr:ATP phosphoribosyltransferase regulatory subunit [Pseudomonadota bacterium]
MGRKDESGDFTKGAGLSTAANTAIQNVISSSNYTLIAEAGRFDIKGTAVKFESPNSNLDAINNLRALFPNGPVFQSAIDELAAISQFVHSSGYNEHRIRFDPTVVRGLEYYTGPVFECELLMDTKDEDGNTVRFGSVGGGGRYDDLVARFTGQQVPATGFSIGVSRLYSALKLVGKAKTSQTLAPVIVTVMDKDRQGDYWNMVQRLRKEGIRAEMYIGTSNMGKQLKYADKRGAPIVIIQGGNEILDENGNVTADLNKRQVQIKDLRLGSELAAQIETREEYASQRLAQVSVPEADLVKTVQEMLARVK